MRRETEVNRGKSISTMELMDIFLVLWCGEGRDVALFDHGICGERKPDQDHEDFR